MASDTGLKKEADDTKASDKPKTKPLDYVMVSYLGSSPLGRKHRVSRGADRKPKFVLANGAQIRDKGVRFTEVSFEDVLKNFNQLLKGVGDHIIAVCRPDNLQPFTVEQFLDLGSRLSSDFEEDLKIDKTVLESLKADQTDTRVWEESKPKAKDSEITKPSLEPAVIAAEERKKLDEAPVEAATDSDDAEEALTEEQMMEMSVKDLQKLASDYGVKNATKLTKKKDLVDAIMEVAAKEQE